MSKRKPSSVLAVVQRRTDQVPLQHGRHLSLASEGDEDLIEVHGQGGAVELRIRLTAEGPVLQLEAVRLSLNAVENVQVECENFRVVARESVELSSAGPVRIHGDADVQVDAAGDVRLTGTLIHLN